MTSSPIPLRLFIGGLSRLPDSGRPTGMFKHPAPGPLALGLEGFSGDRVGDRRIHGGPEKAVHLYPAEHYARLAERFPEAAGLLAPGSIGENLSTRGLSETEVCIGDVLALGAARLQVCQPRNPCWKIDSRYGVEGMAAFIAETGMTGWYLRVLAGGTVSESDPFVLLDRPREGVTLAAAMAVCQAHRPGPEELERVAGAPGIAEGWRKKIADRAAWLRRNPDRASPPLPAFHPRRQD